MATRSDCPLADILLAVFGLVLDRHARDGDASITILPAEQAMAGLHAKRLDGGTPEAPAGMAMPQDMRLAIAYSGSAVTQPPPKCRGVAFRHTRRAHPQDRIVPAPSAGHEAARQDEPHFDLVLDVGEFDDMLFLECCYRSEVLDMQCVERLVQDYVHALRAVVKSFDGGP